MNNVCAHEHDIAWWLYDDDRAWLFDDGSGLTNQVSNSQSRTPPPKRAVPLFLMLFPVYLAVMNKWCKGWAQETLRCLNHSPPINCMLAKPHGAMLRLSLLDQWSSNYCIDIYIYIYRYRYIFSKVSFSPARNILVSKKRENSLVRHMGLGSTEDLCPSFGRWS